MSGKPKSERIGPDIRIECRQCGISVDKPRRAQNRPPAIYCSRQCSSLAKRSMQTEDERVAARRAYDREFRKRNLAVVKAKRAEYRKRVRQSGKHSRKPLQLTEERIARFWSYIDKTGPDQCWPWKLTLAPNGYGGFCGVLAHQIAVILSGRDIPPKMVVDHICRRRDCMNPAHLRVVTRAENTIFNSNSPSALNRLKTHCLNGHPLSGDNLYLRKSNQRICRQCVNDRKRKYRRDHRSDENIERRVA